MAVLENLLEYQRVDAELRKAENSLTQSEERKKLVQAKNAVRNAENRIAEQDNRAKEIRHLRDDITARVEELSKTVDEYADIDDLVAEGGDISFYKRNAQQLSEKIKAAKGELNRLLSEAEALSNEYAKLMEQGKKMMGQYKEYSEKYNALQKSTQPETDEIKKKLAALAKNIPTELLERYNQKRNEKIFPVLVPVAGDTCVCGMDLSISQKGKLTGGNVIECEHCHRFLYNRG